MKGWKDGGRKGLEEYKGRKQVNGVGRKQGRKEERKEGRRKGPRGTKRKKEVDIWS